MSKIGLFYGSSTSNTEYIADEIRDLIESHLGSSSIEVINIGNSDINALLDYDYLILGIPTWDIGELQVDWDIKWDALESLNLHGHKVAIFGLSDQYGYPTTFQDAMGMLAETVLANGAELCGFWKVEGYEFEDSLGLSLDGTAFMGLALDEDNQHELTPQRLQVWTNQVLVEFGLLEKAPAQ